MKRRSERQREIDREVKLLPWHSEVIEQIILLLLDGKPLLRQEHAALTRIAIRRQNAAEYRNLAEYRRLAGNIDPYDMAVLILRPTSRLGRRLQRSFDVIDWQ